MTDTGQDITVPNEMKLADMIALEETTQKRFTFVVDASGLFAVCTWRNYYKDTLDKRVKKETGAWKLLELQTKKVVII